MADIPYKTRLTGPVQECNTELGAFLEAEHAMMEAVGRLEYDPNACIFGELDKAGKIVRHSERSSPWSMAQNPTHGEGYYIVTLKRFTLKKHKWEAHQNDRAVHDMLCKLGYPPDSVTYLGVAATHKDSKNWETDLMWNWRVKVKPHSW